MGGGVNPRRDLSMQGSHLSRRLDSSHFHAQLSALELDKNGARAQGFLEMARQLLAEALLKLRLAGKVVQ